MRRQITLFLFLAVIFSPAARATQPGAIRSELLVSPSWLEQHLHDPAVAVVEVGERTDFEASHIPGARFIATTDLVVDRNGVLHELPDTAALAKVFGDAGLPDHGRIVIYGRKLIPAARAFFTLEYAGRRGSCALLDGGYAAWNDGKRPVDTGAPGATPTQFTVRPDPGVVVGLGPMKMLADAAAMTPASFAVVDARSPASYTGEEPGEGITRGGHIPSAINIPQSANVGESGFKPVEQLCSLYRDAGVAESATVVTYCRTGMAASVDYFVLRYLGRTVHVYDGSFSEWSAAHDTDVTSK